MIARGGLAAYSDDRLVDEARPRSSGGGGGGEGVLAAPATTAMVERQSNYHQLNELLRAAALCSACVCAMASENANNSTRFVFVVVIVRPHHSLSFIRQQGYL